jgi:predicted RNA methylase
MSRSGLDQYYTPDSVARHMVRVVGAKAGDLVLDPACGNGVLLNHLTSNVNSLGMDVTATDKTWRPFNGDIEYRTQRRDFLLRNPGRTSTRVKWLEHLAA